MRHAEAAAFTRTLLCYVGSPPQLTAYHPFVFMIRDTHSGSTLFLGRVSNPLECPGSSPATAVNPTRS